MSETDRNYLAEEWESEAKAWQHRYNAIVETTEKLRQALQFIRDNYGKVCDNYELCNCRSCESSYGAWATADMTLRELEK